MSASMARPEARVLPREYTYEQDGELFVYPDAVDWRPVKVLSPLECIHQETMCILCMTSWHSDYVVELKAPDEPDTKWWRFGDEGTGETGEGEGAN